MKSVLLRSKTMRAGSLFVGIALGLCVFILRLVQLQVVQHEDWAGRSERNHQNKRILEMRRGAMYDRNGQELAISVETYTVNMYTREIKSLSEVANTLSTVLPLTRQEILEKIGTRKGYIPVFKNLERSQANKLLALNLPGIILEENYRRVYPQNNLASNLLGFCGADGHGLEGLELIFDRTMRGYPGLAVEGDVSFGDEGGGQLRVVKSPAGGANLTVTIDSFIQHILEGELAKLVEKYKPVDAMAIVMDPYTGDILGMACLPNYDLNDFAQSSPESHRNRPVVDMFEPGSCMKIFAAGCGIQTGKITPHTRFYCKGHAEVFGRKIKCHGSHALIDVPVAIAESCNAAMVQISQLLESRQLYRLYRDLGFGEPSGIDLPGESQGMLSAPSRWSGLSMASLCIGQELAVTGLQLVSAYAAIANGGKLLKPKIIRKIVSQAGDIQDEVPVVVKREIFSAELSRYLRQLLLGVVEHGTGDLARVADYSIGGKTSTAQKANPKGGYYWDKVVTSFIGMAPALNPRIVLLVAVNEPKGDEKTLFGGKVAAPVFGVIADRVLRYLKVPPDKHPPILAASGSSSLTSGNDQASSAVYLPLEYHDDLADFTFSNSRNRNASDSLQATLDGVLPDYSGITLKEIASEVKGLAIPVQLDGNGIVVEQTPKAGTPLLDVHRLVIRLSPKRNE